MAIFNFKSKRDEVLNHWFAFVDGFNSPPSEFYDTVQKEMEVRKIPSMETSRVEYAEGGLLSDKRIYLRMIRERLAFDTCAAPFGRGYFFSCRSVYSPVVVRWWHILVVLILLESLHLLLTLLLGPWFALIALVGFGVAIAQVFRNTVSLALSDLDAALIKMPVIGPIYERWFRKNTYYREDTRLVYLEVVANLVKELAEDLVASKGVRLLEQYENTPVLGELYKRVPPKERSR